MRLVIASKARPGQPVGVEFNFMWAPTFIGHSTVFRRQLEEELGPQLVGKELTEETLDWAHDKAVEFICSKFPTIEGLRDYLDAIKFVVEQ